MTLETLKRLKTEIKTISDDSLAQFFAVVIEESNRRKSRPELPKGLNGLWVKKDCEPIRGY